MNARRTGRQGPLLLVALVALVSTLSIQPSVAREPMSPRWAVCGDWRTVPVPGDKLYPGGYGSVTDVETVSPTEAWAISDDGYESHNEAHIYHWGGQRWSEVPFPTPNMGGDPKWEFWELDDIEVVSPTEAWVVGFKVMAPDLHYTTRPIVGLWNGTRWRIVPTGLWVRGRLSALTAEPGGRMLAVGSRDVPGGREATLIVRWNGRLWHRVPSPDPGRESGFADVVVAGSNVWAIGSGKRAGEASRLLASRMTPNGWTVRWGPRGQIEAADAVSAREIWAVGSTSAGSRESGLVARWDGHDWVLARRFDRIDRFEDVVAPSSGAVWAVGGAYDPDLNASRPYIARRLSGNWRIEWTRKSAGRVTAIDGTPHNLWTFLTYPPVQYAELWRFTSLHRC